jgi:hypothetical protein
MQTRNDVLINLSIVDSLNVLAIHHMQTVRLSVLTNYSAPNPGLRQYKLWMHSSSVFWGNFDIILSLFCLVTKHVLYTQILNVNLYNLKRHVNLVHGIILKPNYKHHVLCVFVSQNAWTQSFTMKYCCSVFIFI